MASHALEPSVLQKSKVKPGTLVGLPLAALLAFAIHRFAAVKEPAIETRYYDKDSGLLVKVEQVVPSPMGQIPAVSMPADYRDVGGVKIPHKVEETIAGQVKILATLDKVEHNADVPAEKFQLPPEVKALVDKAGAAPATQPR